MVVIVQSVVWHGLLHLPVLLGQDGSFPPAPIRYLLVELHGRVVQYLALLKYAFFALLNSSYIGQNVGRNSHKTSLAGTHSFESACFSDTSFGRLVPIASSVRSYNTPFVKFA